ncbi:MAG: adenosylmethionine decarboxylase [Parvularculaceae bacterium]|nr:adenosylmethionine decarboxylase [Parvularculaceae bacterium]
MSQTNILPFETPANDQHASGEELDHFIQRNGKVFAGTHLIIDLVGAKNLTDKELMERTFNQCVEECGATLLHLHVHTFLPSGGLSGVAVLAESHISVHTWPERDYAAFDVFMCGDAEPEKAIAILKKAFDADQVNVQTFYRGEGVV